MYPMYPKTLNMCANLKFLKIYQRSFTWSIFKPFELGSETKLIRSAVDKVEARQVF